MSRGIGKRTNDFLIALHRWAWKQLFYKVETTKNQSEGTSHDEPDSEGMPLNILLNGSSFERRRANFTDSTKDRVS